MNTEADLLDVNVWLALSASEHPHHPLAQAYWSQAAPARLAFCRVTALGLLRLLTNAHVMGGVPVSPSEAWSAYARWRALDDVVFLGEPAGCEALLGGWAAGGVVSARLWTDAYLAAFAQSGSLRLVTFDGAFERFTGLRLLLLGGQSA